VVLLRTGGSVGDEPLLHRLRDDLARDRQDLHHPGLGLDTRVTVGEENTRSHANSGKRKRNPPLKSLCEPRRERRLKYKEGGSTRIDYCVRVRKRTLHPEA
jgi:hypothetical protein